MQYPGTHTHTGNWQSIDRCLEWTVDFKADEEELIINTFRVFKFQNESDSWFQANVIDKAMIKTFIFDHPQDSLEVAWYTIRICHVKKQNNVLDT